MMVSPISSVRFCGEQNNVSSILERPGKFSSPVPKAEQAPVEEKKSSGTGKKVVGTLATLAVVAATLVALPKVFPNAIKALSQADKEAATLMQKVGHYVATAGEAIAKYTYEPVVKLFKGKSA